jgi:paraquat-inducible protein A
LGLLFISSVSIACGHVSKNVIGLFRFYNHLSEWGMVEVYMLGILVSIIKMYSMAKIHYDLGFFCFIGLVLLTIWSSTVVDHRRFWILIEQQQKKDDPGEAESTDFNPAAVTAREAGLVRCHDCGKLSIDETVGPDEVLRCPRCRATLHVRKPGSLSRTWALVLAGLILYLPANILPMMRVNFMGTPDDSTILDGIIYFFQHGEYLVGGIILTASVLVPLFKIIGIILILLSIRFHWNGWLKHKSVIFRFIEFIGRWSFLDVFVIALLAAMVRFGALTTIEADPAAPYFTAVVVCTMFAALSFDPRIMWDIGAAPTKSED